MLGGNTFSLAGRNRFLEPAEIGLDRRRVLAILDPLALSPQDALLL